MNSKDKNKFFSKLVEQSKFVMRPNKRKMNPKHPDLVAYFRDKEVKDKTYVVYGWVVWSEQDKANVLKCTVSPIDQQNSAQKRFKEEIPTIELPQGFKFEGDDLPV